MSSRNIDKKLQEERGMPIPNLAQECFREAREINHLKRFSAPQEIIA